MGVGEVACRVVGVALGPVGGLDRGDAAGGIEVECARAPQLVVDAGQSTVGAVSVGAVLQHRPLGPEDLIGETVLGVPGAGRDGEPARSLPPLPAPRAAPDGPPALAVPAHGKWRVVQGVEVVQDPDQPFDAVVVGSSQHGPCPLLLRTRDTGF